MADIKYFEEGGKRYKIDSDGEKYRISFSEELQLKNLKEAKKNKFWLQLNFYAKIALIFLIGLLSVVSFDIADYKHFVYPPNIKVVNWFGNVGAVLSLYFIELIGLIASFLFFAFGLIISIEVIIWQKYSKYF